MLNVTRLDLDGTGSPLGLVGKILQAEPNLRIPVPIEELAVRLDISEITELTTEGFEGGLITNDVRAYGAILVRKDMDARRRRFTIGHELGHFLILTHRPAKDGEFLCSKRDMLRWNGKEQTRAVRMEVEANRFSAGILMPAPHLRRFFAGCGDPDLAHVLGLHEHFDVSREAAARAYASENRQRVAIAIVRNGTVLRVYRSLSFPKLGIQPDSPVPRLSSYSTARLGLGQIGPLTTCNSGQWLEAKWGVPLPALYEQVMPQQNGFAMILLWCDLEEEEEDYDPDEDKTAKQRYRERLAERDQGYSRW